MKTACEALEELRRHLGSVAKMGGGEITLGLLQAAADDCAEAVIVTDAEAQIVMVNGAAARLLGTSTRELQRLTWWDITAPSFQGDFDVLWREFLRAGRQRGQFALKRKDGTTVEVGYCAQTKVVGDRHVIVFHKLR